jgi:CheY-like chemotaxis protein
MSQIRVVLAEDGDLLRAGVLALLEGFDDIDVVATATNLPELLAAVDEHRPDVLLTDIRMPPDFTDEGIRAAAELRRTHPGTGVVALTQYTDVEYALDLVREAAEVDPVEPLALKGKSEPVPAFRLLSVLEAVERSHDSAFVGRQEEVEVILATWRRAENEQRSELVTIVGDPGIGKSRLVAEALDSLDVRVARGRCLPYGEGITYWPVVEVVKQLDAPIDPVAAASLGSLLGETTAATSADEIAWAFRKLLEEQAPLVVVFDDIQWGEETFLDLLESLGLLAGTAALLVICISRPELAARRPEWRVALRLGPLPDDAVETLVGDVASGLRERIRAAAGGNPLFVTEMMSMAAGSTDVEVPSTLRALLAARLDQLDEGERRVGEPARDLLRGDRVVAPLPWNELRRIDLFLPRAQLPSPGLDPAEQDGAVVVAEVAEQPPEPLRPTAAPIGDHVHAVADAAATRRGGELLGGRQRMPAGVLHREVREVIVDVEERGTGDVPGEIELAPASGVPELPPAIDELIPHVPTSVERRSRRTTSRQTSRSSPSRSRTPTLRNPHASWSRIDASFSGNTPAVSVQ